MKAGSPSDRYDDGGYSGGTLERPALQRLIRDVEAGRVDTVVCYKIDRLSRSLTDFAKLVDVFERNSVTFVSVTQSFCTTTSMGRLTLNILLCASRSSSGSSPASGSATSSPPPVRRACGWAATRRSATTSGTASWW